MTVRRNPVFASSIALWEDAERQAPEKPRPHLNLGQAYQESARPEDAIREYEHALALNPNLYAASVNLAALFIDRGDLAKGEGMLLRVTTLAPNFTEAFVNLGVLYLRKREPDKAIAALDRVLAANPGAPSAHFNKAEALTMKGDFQQALTHYEAAVANQPDELSFRMALGVVYTRMGKTSEAEKQFLALTNGRAAAEAFRNLGRLRVAADDFDQALRYFEEAGRLRSPFPVLHHDLGVLYLKQSLFDQAIAEFRTTLEQSPGYAPAVLNLATTYEVKGDVVSARGVLESFIATYGGNASPYVAQAHEKLRSLP
jgi:tetratricopeptide (TPR) repeat protein